MIAAPVAPHGARVAKAAGESAHLGGLPRRARLGPVGAPLSGAREQLEARGGPMPASPLPPTSLDAKGRM